MSVNASKLRENYDLFGAVVGFFFLIVIWTVMIRWDEGRNEILTNNEGFRLFIGIMILFPLFFYCFYLFIKGVFNLIWAVAQPKA